MTVDGVNIRSLLGSNQAGKSVTSVTLDRKDNLRKSSFTYIRHPNRKGSPDSSLWPAGTCPAKFCSKPLPHTTAAGLLGQSPTRQHALFRRLLEAEPVAYGEGLVERVRGLVRDGVDAALDVAGSTS